MQWRFIEVQAGWRIFMKSAKQYLVLLGLTAVVLLSVGSVRADYICGDINNDGGGPDITDLIYFMKYMYLGGPEPPIMESANWGGCAGIDLADLVALGMHVTPGGGSEPNCEDQSECLPLPTSGALTLDDVVGSSDGIGVGIGGPLHFRIRLSMNGFENLKGMSHGFRIYSPDGATWGSSSIEVLDELDDITIFDMFRILLPINTDGVGADTLGYSASTQEETTGLPSDFDEVVFQISTGDIFGDRGDQICFDTCWIPPAGPWMWYDGSDRFAPSWDGPRCFFVAVWSSDDWDGDGLQNDEDPCPNVYGWWPDPDSDGLGDYCDNCPDVYNPDQSDVNGDGIGDVCCCINRTDMDGNGVWVDIADLIYLVKYMFQDGPPLPCHDHGDINADGQIDITDLIGLVSYMFQGGFDIVPCPD
jgi:hypothetical protein